MKERIAIVDGIRSPFCKAGGIFKDFEADDLAAYVVKELMARSSLTKEQIDELIFGNVIQSPNSANIARIIAVKSDLSLKCPAFTVNRNCASGMEAIISGASRILLKDSEIVIAGGTESMSNFPVLVNKKMKSFLAGLMKAKTMKQKFSTMASFRLSFLVPQMPEISDPLCGLSMGQTAEVLAREFRISRDEQDRFALLSQERAAKAIKQGILAQEIIPVPFPPAYEKMQINDDGPRENQTLESLTKLKPAFDTVTGSVTAGNSSQVTDGAAAVLLMRESKAKELGLIPLGYILDYASAGLEPSRMGLGPAYATAKLLEKSKLKLADFDLIEINEAFAAQVLAVIKACNSAEFAKKYFNDGKPLGEIDLEKLNVNGGSIALGHPLGASGTRLVITLLKELKRREKRLGLATLCIGGGQGQAVALEVQS